MILFYIFIIIILDGKSLDGGYVCMPVEDLPHYRLWGYGAVGSAFARAERRRFALEVQTGSREGEVPSTSRTASTEKKIKTE